MVDDKTLRAAIDAKVLSEEQADRLREFEAVQASGSGSTENIKFLSNLNDIFLSLGIIILAVGLWVAGGFFAVSTGTYQSYAVIVMLPVAAIKWGLAEYFCGRRMLLLPSMLLALIIVVSVGMAGFYVAAVQTVQNSSAEIGAAVFGADDGVNVERLLRDHGLTTTLVGLFSALAAAGAFYWRFRLPFALFLCALLIAGVLYAIMFKSGGLAVFLGGGALLVVGLLTLLSAIYFDARDPERKTRLSDNAFWLHVAAAPQIIYGVRGLLGIETFAQNSSQALVTVLVLIALSILSLALNRRALIVSGVLTFGGAIWALFGQSGMDTSVKIAGPLIVVGLLIVLLGGGWRSARTTLLKVLPQGGIFARIFPAETALNG